MGLRNTCHGLEVSVSRIEKHAGRLKKHQDNGAVHPPDSRSGNRICTRAKLRREVHHRCTEGAPASMNWWKNTREVGGGGGIRTPGRVTPSTVFKTVAFDRSATPPFRSHCRRKRRRCKKIAGARIGIDLYTAKQDVRYSAWCCRLKSNRENPTPRGRQSAQTG